MSQVMSSLSQTVGSSAPVWIYRIRGADYGPMTSAVMAAWMKEGWFTDDALPLRTIYDGDYYTLGDYKVACGGQNPFELQPQQRPFSQPAPPTPNQMGAMGPAGPTFVNGNGGSVGMAGGYPPSAVRMPVNGMPQFSYRAPSQSPFYPHQPSNGVQSFLPPPTLAAVKVMPPRVVHIGARVQTEPVALKANSVETFLAELMGVRVKIVVDKEEEEEEEEGTIDEQSLE